MTRAWQTWLVYALCVCIVVPTMVWLTITTMRLDRARDVDRQETEMARRYAEMQERISSALWRMDWLLIPLVAQEAARPSFMYQPFYDGPSPNAARTTEWVGGQLRPSPILVQPSDWIKLHFQIDSANQICSPQDPQGNDRELAEVGCGIAPNLLAQNNRLLQTCQQSLSYAQLQSYCSADFLPTIDSQGIPIWQQELLSSQLAGKENPASAKLIDNFAQGASPEAPAAAEPTEPAAQVQQLRSQNRNFLELQQRSKAAQSYAYGQQMQNAVAPSPVQPLTRIGAMRATWVGDKLLLVRQVVIDQSTVIQGCWLDWEKIRAALTAEVRDLFPELELRPLENDSQPANHLQRLATLPVALVVDTPRYLASLSLAGGAGKSPTSISGLRLSIWVAWAGLIAGLAAIALLLSGVMRLSERRNDFVSAVTHELRTPLTTFRMYAEMLAEGMVPDAERQQQYAQTMKIEADRLGHLVENVLQFARLEKQSNRRAVTTLPLADLLDRCRRRLEERAAQSNLELVWDVPVECAALRVRTNPDSIEQILFNLVENAGKYARPTELPQIDLRVQRQGDWVEIRVRDYGPGIPLSQRRQLFRPFTKSDQDAANTAPGVGLGLALCQRMARDLGGALQIDPHQTGAGATFLLRLPL